jgi:hypothetical protein
MIEYREYRRIPVEAQVFFSHGGRPETREGMVFDISPGGCAITSTVPLTNPGSGIRLFIRATDLGTAITVQTAAVRWTSHGEFGIEFLNLSDLDRSRLQRFLHVVKPPMTSSQPALAQPSLSSDTLSA